MLDLAKLLILDGRPSVEMIDYLVDNAVKEIVDKIYSVMKRDPKYNYDMYRIFSLNQNVSQNGELKIGCCGNYRDDVNRDVIESIKRYEPFLQIDNDEYRHISTSWGEIDEKPKSIVVLTYPLTLEVTPNMKKSCLLHQDLSENLEEKDENLSPNKLKI